MSEFYKKYGPWAIVTGASSGIGREFCIQLAALGFNLVMVARREDRLQQLHEKLNSDFGIQTEIAAVDLSASDFIEKITPKTKALPVGLLVNCAGFANTGDFLGNTLKDEIRLLEVNCRAPIILAHRFGTLMKHQGRGAIINVASASAFLPMPKWANYSASKAFVLHFSEALWFELKSNNIDVLAVCPAGVDTEFSRVANTAVGGMDVSQVVETALKKLGKTQTVIPGMGTRFGIFASRFFSRKALIKLGAKATDSMAQ